MNIISCVDPITFDSSGNASCASGFSTQDQASLDLLLSQLISINDFSVTTASSLIAFYLLMITSGFIAGNVVRLLKKA